MTTKNLALLFADICNSTQLYEQLGDLKAKERISECLESITTIAVDHDGIVVKTIGDEVLIRFDSPNDAIHAACAMQDSSTHVVTGRLEIRVALHYGSTIMDDHDVFGDSVNIAARLVSLSKPGQILTSRDTVEILSPLLLERCRHIDRTDVKGKTGVIDIYEVIRLEDDITQMTVGITHKQTYILLMRYLNRDYRFSNDKDQFTMGRNKLCDLVIAEELASRQHVTLESRRGNFFIVDRSTNGTWVRNETGKVKFLRRDEMQLPPMGDISFGKSFGEQPNELLRFRIARG